MCVHLVCVYLLSAFEMVIENCAKLDFFPLLSEKELKQFSNWHQNGFTFLMKHLLKLKDCFESDPKNNIIL